MAFGSFTAGLSGLNANSEALSVIGNNLANINTIGFKSSDVSFEDLVSQSVGGTSVNPTQVGLGVAVRSTSPVFSQGSIESSRVATNVAIQGQGMFALSGPDGRSYTRAGDFSFDNSGALVTPDGHYVQGYTSTDPTTGQILTTGALSNITVPLGALQAPVPSSSFQASSNLDAGAPTGATFTTSIPLYDSMGTSHATTLTYTKTGLGAWSYQLTADGSEVSGGTAGTPSTLASGTLAFDGTGTLTTVNGAAAANVSITTPSWSDGAAASALTWKLLDAQQNPTLTGFASASSTSSISQNGAPAGTVSDVTVSSDGRVIATFGQGQTVAVAQVALATFDNPQGLVKLGGSRFGESEAAGLPNVGVAGTGGRGSLTGSALEQSNVDMAREFTQMILAQRGYQANSKTITVSDQVLVDTLNLKQ